MNKVLNSVFGLIHSFCPSHPLSVTGFSSAWRCYFFASVHGSEFVIGLSDHHLVAYNPL